MKTYQPNPSPGVAANDNPPYVSRYFSRPPKTLARHCLFTAVALFTILFGTVAFGAPLGTEFWYNGLLNDNGKLANGNYDFIANLYNVESGGNALPNQNTINNLPVVNGLVQFSLDFKGTAFDGTKLWLELQVKKSNAQNFDPPLSPRMLLTATPYALYAPTAATATTATTANGVANNAVTGPGIQDASITTSKIQDASITASKIGSGQVVTALNGLHDAVSLQAGLGISLSPNGNNTLTIASSGGGSGWSLTGNSGITPGVNFLGTLDDEPMEVQVNGWRSFRLEYAGYWTPNASSRSVNVIGGLDLNQVVNGAIGATIAGGGYFSASGATSSYYPNQVGASSGTIGGGAGNSVGGQYGTVPGGFRNQADGIHSFAAGNNAHAAHDRTFVWSDGSGGSSSGANRFEVFATGGMTLSSTRGLGVNAASTIISGGWDPFDVTAPAEKTGLGRWGLFMESPGLVVGMPGTDVWGTLRTIAFGRYHLDGSYDELMSIQNTDGRARFLGQVSCCSIEIRGGCDVAEPFRMSQSQIPKGAVVVIDESHPGELKLSERPYDTRVAGIVSGAKGIHPGIALHQEGVLEGGENVALSGRVYVLADASSNAIHPGDLLTTSSRPGHAMKVADPSLAHGAILGKAMSSLEAGQGEVLVLVTLE
jgi:hypothetical protein